MEMHFNIFMELMYIKLNVLDLSFKQLDNISKIMKDEENFLMLTSIYTKNLVYF